MCYRDCLFSTYLLHTHYVLCPLLVTGGYGNGQIKVSPFTILNVLIKLPWPQVFGSEEKSFDFQFNFRYGFWFIQASYYFSICFLGFFILRNFSNILFIICYQDKIIIILNCDFQPLLQVQLCHFVFLHNIVYFCFLILAQSG